MFHKYLKTQKKEDNGQSRTRVQCLFKNGLSKYIKNSVYYHHQSTLKRCFTTILVFI